MTLQVHAVLESWSPHASIDATAPLNSSIWKDLLLFFYKLQLLHAIRTESPEEILKSGGKYTDFRKYYYTICVFLDTVIIPGSTFEYDNLRLLHLVK